MSERQTVAGAYEKIEGHEALCAERYRNIAEAISDLKAFARWIIGGLAGIGLSLIGWMAVQLYTANNARIDHLDRPPLVVQQSQGR